MKLFEVLGQITTGISPSNNGGVVIRGIPSRMPIADTVVFFGVQPIVVIPQTSFPCKGVVGGIGANHIRTAFDAQVVGN